MWLFILCCNIQSMHYLFKYITTAKSLWFFMFKKSFMFTGLYIIDTVMKCVLT